MPIVFGLSRCPRITKIHDLTPTWRIRKICKVAAIEVNYAPLMEQPLFDAIKAGNLDEAMRLATDNPALLTARDPNGASPVLVAGPQGLLGMVTLENVGELIAVSKSLRRA